MDGTYGLGTAAACLSEITRLDEHDRSGTDSSVIHKIVTHLAVTLVRVKAQNTGRWHRKDSVSFCSLRLSRCEQKRAEEVVSLSRGKISAEFMRTRLLFIAFCLEIFD